MRIPRTTTCSVWYRLRCGILLHTAVFNNVVRHIAVFNNIVRHTAIFNNAVQLIAHFTLNAQLIYNALLAHSIYLTLPTHLIVFA